MQEEIYLIWRKEKLVGVIPVGVPDVEIVLADFKSLGVKIEFQRVDMGAYNENGLYNRDEII